MTRRRSPWLLTLASGMLVAMPGVLLCLSSAAAFGAMAIFGKLAYGEGVTVGTLLAVRFVLAAVLFWALVAATRTWRMPARRDLVRALLLGAVGYSAQAGAFFAALERMDASLLSLLLYTFPALVAVASLLLGRERLTRRTVAALICASAGLVLVLGAAGRLDPLGTVLALTAAAVYAAYILSSQDVAGRLGPLVLSALVCSGAAVTLTVAALALSDLRPGAVTAAGWGWLAGIAVVSTVAAVGLFFAGLARVGPTAAAILSTLEPVVTVVLAALAFGEVLRPGQLAGGALVLGAVAVLTLPRRWVRSRHERPARGNRPGRHEDAGDRRRRRPRGPRPVAVADAD